MDVLLSQARQWEETGEYERAVDCYLKGKKNTCLKIIDTIHSNYWFFLSVNRSNTNNSTTMATAWTKAAELAIKFLDSDKAIGKKFVLKLSHEKNIFFVYFSI